MARWIPGSVTADLAPLSVERTSLGRRPRLAAVIGRPAGIAGAGLISVVVLVAILGPSLASIDPFALSGAPLQPPSPAHPLGTDALGRDLLSGVLHGARTSLLIASAVGLIAFIIGVTVGVLAGFFGGWADDVLMRITELFQVLPRLFLIVVVLALFGAGSDRLILVLALTSWLTLARVVRGETLAIRDHDFVRAALTRGASNLHVIWREVMPGVMPGALVMAGLIFGQALLVEASIGFLGLGDPNAISWGLLAGHAQSFVRVAWWLPLFPGLAITSAVLGANLLADAIASAYRRQ